MKPVRCPFDRVLFRGGSVMVGEFVCPVEDPRFQDTGPIENNLMVVPFRPVEIHYRRARTVVADSTRVLFYNRGTRYRRTALNGFGDRSFWIAFEEEALESALRLEGGTPFGTVAQPLSLSAYLAARALYQRLVNGTAGPLEAEELAFDVLAQSRRPARRAPPPLTPRQRGAVAAAEAYLSKNYTDTVRLAEVAGAAACSPYHLSRLFRRHRGVGLHRHLLQLRLRDAVCRLQENRDSLTEISMDLGFSSPSHFSATFRERLGTSPSRFRRHSSIN